MVISELFQSKLISIHQMCWTTPVFFQDQIPNHDIENSHVSWMKKKKTNICYNSNSREWTTRGQMLPISACNRILLSHGFNIMYQKYFSDCCLFVCIQKWCYSASVEGILPWRVNYIYIYLSTYINIASIFPTVLLQTLIYYNRKCWT